ncbi:MAG: aminotransferase class I/II-fold pyridoxal phosphate-dependent enzyme [Melioribacteraceae bacterium]|nr:aminotransferase class I/II-fold pyridoxal phosphate-dependent enzyme [Melioribacteraceae bacterium]
MAHNNNLKFDSICVHGGIGDYEFGPVVPPIYQTSTFRFKDSAHGAALFKGEVDGYIYTRMKNPTIEAMENAVAQLEGGFKGLGCASGMAAVNTVLTTLLKSGDHIVCSRSVYGPTRTLVETVLSKFGVESTFVNSENFNEIESAFKPNTTVLYLETPGNPTLSITDIETAVKFAHDKNALVVIDNTFMSPALQQPFEFGVDVILHSMTKFLNGHADVVGGVVVVRDQEMYLKMRKVLNQLGGVIDPFNSFLVHRGLKTLSLRMKKHTENSLPVAEFLEKHPKVKWVRYPGLKSHPQYELGLKQHKAFGGMISFELNGGYKAGEILMNSVKFCQLAVSLGGVETLIQHPASMTHLTMGKEAREEAGITDGLVRLSVGIEDVTDIIADLEQALQKITD